MRRVSLRCVRLPSAPSSESKMIIEHQGKTPRIHPTAWIAPNAVISGDVVIGEGTRVLYGAVVVAEGAPVHIGKSCVIMEQAVIRGAGGGKRQFPTVVGDYVVIGPHAYVTGCRLDYRAYVATNAVVFNGATVGANAAVAVGGVVHIATRIPPETVVPLKHIAIGDPCKVYAPSESDAILDELIQRNFKEYVFGLRDEQILAEYYARHLAAHVGDREVTPEPSLASSEPIPPTKPDSVKRRGKKSER
jgi:carbonic anhydrase/acetyltransferase-like protein (isoleucine patch superfamily)